ncbi:hypothetical protein MMC17_009861 [Xylographa soralifera]|nr:hypothetical protein [Xylographa soralifera]
MGELSEYWKDVKAHKKRQQAANPPRRRCYDWMIVSGDCHYAKNRSSFTDYRPIQMTAQGLRVIGIGTVRLQVWRSPGASDTHTLLLENVLHTPDAMCNGFRSQFLGGSESWSADGVQGLDGPTGQPSWYGVHFCGLCRLALAGNPRGESVLEERKRDGVVFLLSMYLRDEERASYLKA